MDSEERIVYVSPRAREALKRLGVEDPRTVWDLPSQLQPAVEASRPRAEEEGETRKLAEGLWGVYLPVRELDPEWLRGMVEAEQMAAVGQLAATVAQEIGGPNTSIQVAVDHLIDGCGPDHQDQRETLGQVLKQTERITRLTRQLIALADPGHARLDAVDLNEIAEGACDLMVASMQERGIECQWELSSEPVWAMADRNHLLQALVNLLLNARTALQSWDGDRKVRIRSESNSERVYIHLEDSGPGVPPEDASRIFMPFVSTTGGTGMGLFLTRQILVEQGGGVRVKSPNEMGGATFTVYLDKATHD
jgi:signal transduction histidine kinase